MTDRAATMGPITRLFAHYKAYHEHGPLLLRYLSLLGLIGFPLLYVMRFVRPSAGYDDLAIRLFNVAICLGLFLRERWPAPIKPYYLPYSYAVLIITLPLTFVFTSLKNGGNPAAVGNTFFAVFLLMLLADWRNMIVMLLTGFGLGAALYAFTDPNPKIPMEYVARLPVLITGIVGGSMFKYALQQATAERVRQAYASLAGSIAHEMRNPLAQVRHSLEHIRHALPMPSARAQQVLVEGRSIEQMYSHVSQGEMAVRRGLQVIAMTLDEVNAKALDPGKLGYLRAADVCLRAVEEFGYETEQQRARVSVEVERDFVFRGDETAFQFVLFNLLKNALYYLPAFPQATVRVLVGDGRIAVRDTGPGIAPEVVAGLFQPFRTSGKAGGTGLGLAYCRRVMLALGGGITCESVPGSYTEFTMTFPPVTAQQLETRRAETLAEARRLFANRRVLVVDDDAAVRSATRQKLLPLYCIVREAADGVEAMQALRESAYDLVMLDLNMPRVDGYEVAEAIRGGRVPANADVCLVAHTSEPPHLARVKTANAGFDGFVSKPGEQLALVQALMGAMEARARNRARPQGWLAGRRILLADDNAYNRTAVGAYLKHAGASVVEVGSGQEALDRLAGGGSFDAVLLDIHMPVMDGVASARAIRTGALEQSGVPMLAITAHAAPQLMETARAAGIADFITKPVEAALLFEKLARLLGVQTPQQQPAAPAPVPQPGSALLDEERLQGYLRIGMLHELVEEYVPQINALVDRLEAAEGRGDLQAALDALHSLVGMSGEAGAQALYRYSRELYVPMLERGHWPAAPGWAARIRELTAKSNQEMRDWLAAHGAPALE